MIRSLKSIKNRIRSIESTKKITHALEMISVSKLTRVDKRLFALSEYYRRLNDLALGFINNTPGLSSPFLKKGAGGKTGLFVISSDSGLCGTYNNNIFRRSQEFIDKHGPENIEIINVGMKGLKYFKKQEISISDYFTDIHGRYRQEKAEEIADSIFKHFLSGRISEIFMIYTHYKSALLQVPVLEKLVNLEKKEEERLRYILEPDARRIEEELIPLFLKTKINLTLLEGFTSEHASRALAMKTATENADELLEKLTLQRNKIRQANITQDIMEVVSSSEALKA